MRQTVWFTALVCSICLEGLGRRYFPFIPGVVFYFLKDVVLLAGLFFFRPSTESRDSLRSLFRPFDKIVLVAVFWTVLEVFNPDQKSYILALVGLRSYWLWWLAPLVIATALRNSRHKDNAIYALLVLVGIISMLATVQFMSPADSNVNMYAVWNGKEVYAADMAVVESTGRARVASTFAFITGFADFTILIPALLLSLGLDAKSPNVRRGALAGTLITAAVIPMSGSRSTVVMGAAMFVLSLWTAGLFFTSIGRRILIGGIVGATLTVVAFPEAFAGLQSRFEDTEETTGRFELIARIVPPIALARFDYPPLGVGTGMQQNARVAFGIGPSQWDIELEMGRYLVELGPFGFMLIWLAKLGLTVALFRAYRLLKRGGRRGSAAAALAYCGVTLPGNLGFDHYWQALYFTGCGFILSEVIAVQAVKRAASEVVAPVEASTSSALAPRYDAA